MASLALAGKLMMISATIDWRAEAVQCHGVFRSEDGGSLEVEYRVMLSPDILDLLAQSFLAAGLPMLKVPGAPAIDVGSGRTDRDLLAALTRRRPRSRLTSGSRSEVRRPQSPTSDLGPVTEDRS